MTAGRKPLFLTMRSIMVRYITSRWWSVTYIVQSHLRRAMLNSSPPGNY